MLMKCKTCSTEFIPPRKNVRNCAKCIIFKKARNTEEASVKEEEDGLEEVKVDEDETNNESNASEQYDEDGGAVSTNEKTHLKQIYYHLVS